MNICHKISNLIDIHYTHDVSGCVICICSKVEDVDKEGSLMNFIKDVV